MRRVFAALAVMVLVVPSAASAQRGGGGGGGRSSGGLKEGFGGPSQSGITSSKIQDLNPLNILLKKHKDLSLTDDQSAKLKQMNDQLDEAQKPAMHSLDSLSQEIANLGPRPTGNDQGLAQQLNQSARMVAGNIRQQYDSVETAAKALMSDDQKKKADDVLNDSHDKLNKLVGRRGG